MSSKEIPLAKFQTWMQHIIEHPGSDSDAWHSSQAEGTLPFEQALENVLPSRSLQPMERVAIYRRMFALRMIDAMQIDYPGVLHYMGEEEFNRVIVEEYVQKYPSHSYTLNDLGKQFPRFLTESNIPDKEFLADLARLELSITTVMDLEESTVLTADDINAVPVDKWEVAMLTPIAALELLQFDYPVDSFLDTAMEKEKFERPIAPAKTWVVVYRENFNTWRKEISEEEYVLLSLLRDGKTIGDAITVLLQQFPQESEELQNKIFQWFNAWIANGMFHSLKWK